MKHKTMLSILAVFISITAFCGPARRGPVELMQPDGTTFSARIRGDEFMKLVTTAEGNSIVQDADGWWCYAGYDADGVKFSSGYRVGGDVPDGVKSMSRHIPYGRLAAKAKTKRAERPDVGESIIKRISRQRGIDTKSGSSQTITKHAIILLAQFQDIKFKYTKDDFVNLLTQNGYKSNGATGSAKEYFDAQFAGAVDFSFVVGDIVTLSRNVAYYGGNDSDDNDKAPEKMVREACELSDSKIDFSLYDDDGDGTVDNVFVFFAGGDEADGAGDDRIWSHAWYLYSGAGDELYLDGKLIDSYACTAELARKGTKNVMAGIGTFCHEYAHTFGLPDMYDTDYEGSGGTSAALWTSTSLMDAGNQNNFGNTPPYFNAIEREILGISEPAIINTNGGYTLEPIHKSGKSYRLNTDNADEYYLLECRSEEDWDKYCGGSGMLVYHIDKSSRKSGYSDSYSMDMTALQRWEMYNEVNGRPDHQCANLLEADKRQDGFSVMEEESFIMSLGNIRGIFFPYSNSTSITPGGSPGFSFWSGKDCEYSVTNIRRTDEGVGFNVIGFSGTELPPNVVSVKAEAFTDAAIILFESDRVYDGEAIVQWGKTGEEMESINVKPYLSGKYAVTLEGLQAGNKTYTVRIHFELDGLVGEEKEVAVMTKKQPAVSWPFIYMGGIVKNSDGTLPPGSRLPLRVYNAGDAAETVWTFNGQPISTKNAKGIERGYYTVDRSGILKAHITWEDGSEEIIMKEITIGEENE